MQEREQLNNDFSYYVSCLTRPRRKTRGEENDRRSLKQSNQPILNKCYPLGGFKEQKLDDKKWTAERFMYQALFFDLTPALAL